MQIDHFKILLLQQENAAAVSTLTWKESDLDVMDTRLQAVLSLAVPQERVRCSPALEPGRPEGRGYSSLTKETSPLSDGWRLLSETDGWRPCPIGIYIGGREQIGK